MESEALNTEADYGFQIKQQLNWCTLRCPRSEYPLPPVHRACRDGDILSLTYSTIQGDKLAVFRSINARDQFLMWTPIHWADRKVSPFHFRVSNGIADWSFCNGVVENLDHYEILIPNGVNHNLHISNGENQWTDSANGFQNEHVNHEHFKSTSYNSCLSAKDGDVDMHSEEVQETNAIKTISRYHYLNQPVRCLGLFGHMQ